MEGTDQQRHHADRRRNVIQRCRVEIIHALACRRDGDTRGINGRINRIGVAGKSSGCALAAVVNFHIDANRVHGQVIGRSGNHADTAGLARNGGKLRTDYRGNGMEHRIIRPFKSYFVITENICVGIRRVLL